MSAELAMQPAPTYADLQAMFWREFVAKYEHGFRPRCPTESLEGLVPATGNGYCMTPVFSHGCRLWFDPSLRAEPGDVVDVQFHPTVVERILRERADDAEFQRVYGDNAKRGELGRAIKLLCSYRGRQYLVTNDSMTPLDGGQYGPGAPLGPSKILGVLRRVGGEITLLPGVRSPADTSDLNPNAATEVSQTSSSGTSTLSVNTVVESYQTASTITLEVAPEDVIEITATSRIAVSTSGSATGYGGLRVYYKPSGGAVSYAGELMIVASGVDQITAASGSVTGLSGTYDFGLQNYVNMTGGTGTVQTDTSARTLIVTRCKR